jgi:hypothetical protein
VVSPEACRNDVPEQKNVIPSAAAALELQRARRRSRSAYCRAVDLAERAHIHGADRGSAEEVEPFVRGNLSAGVRAKSFIFSDLSISMRGLYLLASPAGKPGRNKSSTVNKASRSSSWERVLRADSVFA